MAGNSDRAEVEITEMDEDHMKFVLKKTDLSYVIVWRCYPTEHAFWHALLKSADCSLLCSFAGLEPLHSCTRCFDSVRLRCPRATEWPTHCDE